jgi:hypothetical protein
MLGMESKPPKGGPMEIIYAALAIIIGISLLIGVFGQWIIIDDPIPPGTTVYVKDESKVYYAPPYILGNKYPAGLDVSDLRAMPVAEAEASGFKADPQCAEMGYFKERYNLKDRILIKIGLVEPEPSRWNKDGSWNW